MEFYQTLPRKKQSLTFEWGSKNFGIFRNCRMWAAGGAVPDLEKRENKFCNQNTFSINRRKLFVYWVQIVNCWDTLPKCSCLSQNSSDTSIPRGSFSLSHTQRNTETETKELSERKTFPVYRVSEWVAHHSSITKKVLFSATSVSSDGVFVGGSNSSMWEGER